MMPLEFTSNFDRHMIYYLLSCEIKKKITVT